MIFEKQFSVRVHEGWENFVKGEAKLRELIDKNLDSNITIDYLATLLSPAFEEVYAEVGFNGEKYELILNLEGDWSRLFSLTYFRRQAPDEISKHWNILVGRQSTNQRLANYQINICGESVCAKDIWVWTEWVDKEARVSVYCETLVPLLKEREGDAYWIVYTMLDYAIGELTEMQYISELKILETPCAKTALELTELMAHFMDNLSLSKEELFDAERYCQLYSGYRMKPSEDSDDGLRRDVFTGSSCFVSLLNDFWNGETGIMDVFHRDGIVAGYFCYPLYGFEGEDRSAQILDFRDEMADLIEETAGSDSFTYIGGATGIYYGYLDFIAWDLKAVLDAAVSVFERSDVEWAMFHSFRQDDDGLIICEGGENNGNAGMLHGNGQ